MKDEVQGRASGKVRLREGDENALPVRHSKRVSEGVPRLFAPREIVLLEQLLRGLREAFGTNDFEWKTEHVAAMAARYRKELPELHTFVRGMIYGL